MAFFNSFTDSLKQKWLQFFQVNRDWIQVHMEVESVYTPDGGKRPSSYLILGVVNALEPKLAQLMFPFSKLNPDADTLIEVLDLHFDPDIALGNRYSPQIEPETHHYASVSVVEEISEDETIAISHTNGFGLDAEPETAVVSELKATQNGLGDITLSNGHQSKDEFHEEASTPAVDFGEVSFDVAATAEETLDEAVIEELNTPDENAFKDVLSDVWGDETALQKGEENNDFLGEELPSGVFDEAEIARLFPNA